MASALKNEELVSYRRVLQTSGPGSGAIWTG